MANERKSRRADDSSGSKPGARKQAARPSHARGGLLELDSETSARLLIFGAVALVIAVAAGFLIFGYWYSVIKPRNRTVLQVADQKVSYSAMKERMAYEFLQNSTYQTSSGVQLLGEATYQTKLNELTEITQASSRLGVSLSTEEIDQRLRAKMGIAANGDQRAFADGMRKALDLSGLSEAEYRSISLADSYKTKILEEFKSDAPATELQAKLAIISAQTAEDANKAIDRINSGDDFETVAKSVSQDPDVQTTGGVKDYLPKEALDASIRDYAFSADVGALSGPIPAVSTTTSTDAVGTPVFYVVRVLDRSDQPIADAQRAQIADQKLPEWLKATQDELLANGGIKRDWDTTAQADAFASISDRVFAKLAELQKQAEEDQQKQQSTQATVVAQLTSSPQVPNTPSAESTPVPGTTPAEGGQSGSSPVAPAAPVAPGGDGQ